MQAPVYSPLNPHGRPKIRILSLYPGSHGDQLEAQLRFHELGNEPGGYAALSYTWGNQTRNPGETIRVNGHTIQLARNLYAALLQLRRARQPRHLWIDALCINQEDVSEKHQQVKLMQQIYSKSRETIIWFGEDMEPLVGQLDSDFFTRGRLAIEANAETSRELFRRFRGPDSDGLIPRFTFWPEERNSTHTYSNSLVQRFPRRQINREISPSPSVEFTFIASAGSMDYQSFYHFIQLHTDHKSSGDTQTAQYLSTCQTQLSQKKRRMLSLLGAYDKFEWQDDRDRMAAALDVWTDESTPWSSFKVDYTLPLEENYLGFATAMVTSGHCLSILYAAESRRNQEGDFEGKDLSSWVPDWRKSPLSEPGRQLPKYPCRVVRRRFLKMRCRKCYRFEADASEEELAQEVYPARIPRVNDLICALDTETGEMRFVLRPDSRYEGAYSLVREADDGAIWQNWVRPRVKRLDSEDELSIILIA